MTRPEDLAGLACRAAPGLGRPGHPAQPAALAARGRPAGRAGRAGRCPAGPRSGWPSTPRACRCTSGSCSRLPAAALRTPARRCPRRARWARWCCPGWPRARRRPKRLVVAAAVLGMDSRLADVPRWPAWPTRCPRSRRRPASGSWSRRRGRAPLRVRARADPAAAYRDLGASRRAELHRGAARLATGAAALAHRRPAPGRRSGPGRGPARPGHAELAAGHRAEAAEHLLTAVQVAGPEPRGTSGCWPRWGSGRSRRRGQGRTPTRPR